MARARPKDQPGARAKARNQGSTIPGSRFPRPRMAGVTTHCGPTQAEGGHQSWIKGSAARTRDRNTVAK